MSRGAVITYGDLLKALADAENAGLAPVEGLTVAEWAEVWGVNKDVARSRIKQALKAELMRTAKTLRENMLGRMCPTQVYQVKGKDHDGSERSTD